MADLPQPTTGQLATKLAELLVAGSLYKKFVYNSSGCHRASRQARYGRLPLLTMYCDGEDCRQETKWEAADPDIYFRQDAYHNVQYTCRNCGRNSVRYW